MRGFAIYISYTICACTAYQVGIAVGYRNCCFIISSVKSYNCFSGA